MNVYLFMSMSMSVTVTSVVTSMVASVVTSVVATSMTPMMTLMSIMRLMHNSRIEVMVMDKLLSKNKMRTTDYTLILLLATCFVCEELVNELFITLG